MAKKNKKHSHLIREVLISYNYLKSKETMYTQSEKRLIEIEELWNNFQIDFESKDALLNQQNDLYKLLNTLNELKEEIQEKHKQKLEDIILDVEDHLILINESLEDETLLKELMA